LERAENDDLFIVSVSVRMDIAGLTGAGGGGSGDCARARSNNMETGIVGSVAERGPGRVLLGGVEGVAIGLEPELNSGIDWLMTRGLVVELRLQLKLPGSDVDASSEPSGLIFGGGIPKVIFPALATRVLRRPGLVLEEQELPSVRESCLISPSVSAELVAGVSWSCRLLRFTP
jgi:hypothetical protein